MSGFRVVLQDLTEVHVPLAVDYVVSDDGDLVFSNGDRGISRFGVGTWVEVLEDISANQLRESWPPENLGELMGTLLHELVVRFGLGAHETSRSRSKYAAPSFNDFNAFVEELMKDEDLTPPYDRRSREFFERAVATTFGVDPRVGDVGLPGVDRSGSLNTHRLMQHPHERRPIGTQGRRYEPDPTSAAPREKRVMVSSLAKPLARSCRAPVPSSRPGCLPALSHGRQ